MKQFLIFIKTYWQFVILMLGGSTVAALNAVSGDIGNMVFAIAFVVLAAYAWFKKMDYDDLYEQHADLVLDYIRELNSNLNFVKTAKQRLSDILTETEEIKKEVKPVAKKKKPAAKKTKKA